MEKVRIIAAGVTTIALTVASALAWGAASAIVIGSMGAIITALFYCRMQDEITDGFNRIVDRGGR